MPARVTLQSENPKLSVRFDLISAIARPLPRPKYEQLDRYGLYDLPKYAGQAPFEMPMLVKLGGDGASVEDEIRTLERLMERPQRRSSPPEVKTVGPVPHDTLTWWILSVDEDVERSKYEWRGEKLHAVTFVATITLLQRVTDTAASASIASTSGAKGIGTTTKVRKGEEDLYDVAERHYKNSSFALAISKANPRNGNPMPLGTRLKPGQTLRMP